MAKSKRSKSHVERPLRLFRSAAEPPPHDDIESRASSDGRADDQRHELKRLGSYTSLLTRLQDENKARPHIAFHRHAEATPSELFYDLFFVANLATFTTQNEVSNIDSLGDYIGFFCIIWFTWFQVSLYDVRFSRDSVFDRLCKVAQFGVMIGFSFIAYSFDPAGASTGFVDGKSLSLVLMASRLVICLQYLATLITLRGHRGTTIPLCLMIAVYVLAAAIFLGFSFDFTTSGGKREGSHAYITWYVVSVLESILTITISCVWRFASFKGTHLVERMSLMTLIILGEGILGLSTAVVNVWSTTYYYPGLGAAVMSTLLLIYSFYQLYFDTLAEEHFGTLRQQVWAFLHFPLHLGLVLFDEGTKQFIIWNTARKQQLELSKLMGVVPIFQQVVVNNNLEFAESDNTTEYFTGQAEALWNSFDNFTDHDLGIYAATNTTLLNKFYYSICNGTTAGSDAVIESVFGFWTVILDGILKNLSIEGAEVESSDSNEIEALLEESEAAFSLFDMVFTYFYVGTSVALLLILALWLLSKRSKHTLFDYVRFTAWAAVGLTIGLLALLDISAVQSDGPGDTFVNGNWVLPTPMIMLVSLVILFHLPFGRD